MVIFLVITSYITISVSNQNLIPLHEKCPYSEFFWSVFSRTRTAYGDLLWISPYSIQMRENEDQKNVGTGHFLRNPDFMWNLTWYSNFNSKTRKKRWFIIVSQHERSQSIKGVSSVKDCRRISNVCFCKTV